MPRRNPAEDREQLLEELERYRDAAELTLDQLDACADLLVDMRQAPLARQIRANRRSIQRAMRDRS